MYRYCIVVVHPICDVIAAHPICDITVVSVMSHDLILFDCSIDVQKDFILIIIDIMKNQVAIKFPYLLILLFYLSSLREGSGRMYFE